MISLYFLIQERKRERERERERERGGMVDFGISEDDKIKLKSG